MPNPALDLERHLEHLCAAAQHGDRLPTVRELMRSFGVSQGVVQRALEALKARGLIAAQVGRGTYFQPAATGSAVRTAAPAPTTAPRTRSVLLLRRAGGVARGRALAEQLEARLVAQGHSVLEVSYTDPDHARAALQGLPRFDACMLQSNFAAIPTALLGSLRPRAEVIAVDGLALVGMDVESVGTEWGEPLEEAIDHLQALGHRRICFACSAHSLLPTQLGQRRLERLVRRRPGLQLQALAIPVWPGAGFEEALVASLQAHADAAGAPRPTALVAVGVDNGARLHTLLDGAGWPVPARLSVVLLGRTDLAAEHADFFDTVGCRVADQAETLHAAIEARWADPQRPYAVRLIPLAERAGRSCAPPPAEAPAAPAPVRLSAARPSAAARRR
jgi:DNA-binding LacI/PurR family transcriptional regulator